jgi:guanylate kinase
MQHSTDSSDARRVGSEDSPASQPSGRSDHPWPHRLYEPRQPRVFVISGPTAVGKDSLIVELRARTRGLRQVRTCTTRPRRHYEVDGEHYDFLSREVFEQKVAAGAFLEHNCVHGELYGTPKENVTNCLAGGDDALLKIDVKGGRDVRAVFPNSVLIFLAPESLAVLRERLARRASESVDDWRRRIATAEAEMAVAVDYDYFVVNRHGQLGEAVAQVAAIVEAERVRVRT